MQRTILARDLCIRTLPAEERMLALINSYFDDSQTEGKIWVVAGYLGSASQWDSFERLWDEALRRHGVPYFHMREMAKPHGEFKKWHPPEDHQDEVVAFFKDLVKAIRESQLHMFGSAVWIKELARFNSEKNLKLEPYPLAAYACLSQMAHKHALPVTAIFDRVEKVDDKLAKARAYAESDRILFPGLCDFITSAPLAKGLTSKKVPALQAADFIAWEARKAYLTLQPWQSLPDRPLVDREEQWQHLGEWSRENTGQEYPIQRKSLEALIGDEMPINAVVWDYHQLCTTHDRRRGIWAQEGDE
jgi:hypothetical protein